MPFPVGVAAAGSRSGACAGYLQGETRNVKKGLTVADKPENTDDAKGRIKEATGKLTGDKEMENEGKLDKASGKAKEGVDKVREALKED